MLLFLSSMMNGNHEKHQLPVVMLGKGGGRIKTGRVLDYADKPSRKVCSLYLVLMDKAGVPVFFSSWRFSPARAGEAFPRPIPLASRRSITSRVPRFDLRDRSLRQHAHHGAAE
jgi:hypothetical protein